MKKIIISLVILLITTQAFSQGTQLHSGHPIYSLNGNIGIGTTSPTEKLRVIGQDVSFLSSTLTNTLSFGRNVNEYLKVLVEDNHTFMDLIQDADGDTDHILHIRNLAAGASGNNDIRFSTGGLELLTIKTGGKVGIGTTSPGRELEVHGSGNVYTKIEAASGSNAAIELSETGGELWQIRNDGSSNDMIFSNSTGTKLRLVDGGKLGIGGVTPNRELEVYGSGNVYSKIFSDNGSNAVLELVETGGINWSIINEAVTNEFKIRQDGQVKFTISDNGKVGIGTASPNFNLDVSGTINSTGDLSVSSDGLSKIDGNSLLLNNDNSQSSAYVDFRDSNGTRFRMGSGIETNGKFSINNHDSDTELFSINDTGNAYISGNLESKKIKVTTTPGNWPDYIFASNYQLTPLSVLEAFVKQNKHLPEVPSAQEVAEKGQDLGARSSHFT